MRECENEDLQDALPEFAAGRLAGAERARVAEHVAGCAECAAEVEMLRVARQVITQDAPPADVERIVAMLPAPPQLAQPAPEPAPEPAGRPALVLSGTGTAARAAGSHGKRAARGPGYRPVWSGWRIAAAVSVIAIGGLSVAVLRDLAGAHGDPVTVPAVVATSGAGSAGSIPEADTENIAASDPGLAVGGGLADLSEGEMEGLLKDLDGIEASPSGEPDAAAPALHGVVVQ
jgi:anti-sigma factor RsiW